MTKVGFVSLGCPKNLVDSEVMMGILSRGGYELTPRADEADVLVDKRRDVVADIKDEPDGDETGNAVDIGLEEIAADVAIEQFHDRIPSRVLTRFSLP